MGLAASGPPDDLRQFLARLQWSMATSSRSLARRWGFWLVQFSRRLSSFRTRAGSVIRCRSINSATRAAVHNSVRQPWALAPSEQALQLRKLTVGETGVGGRGAAWRRAMRAMAWPS